MRKFMILGALVALVVAALALPALAQQDGLLVGEDRQDYYEDLWDGFEDRYEDSAGWDAFEDRYEDGFEEQGFFAFADDRFFAEEDFEDEGFFFGDEGRFFFDEEDEDEDFDGGGFGAGVSQSFDQEAESGDVSQSFNVSNSGDNSNQCANVQGVANTGNAQNQIGVLQYGSEADDFEFEDSGSSITVSPNSTTRCDQAVNQAATAYGR
ncbi:MAG: hypothetical protein M3426_04510 [Actinomycetota bacterium]|nr:hypothetical protein [Actinomycetota bacterium]